MAECFVHTDMLCVAFGDCEVNTDCVFVEHLYMLCLCSYEWASSCVRRLGVAVCVRRCRANFDCSVCACVWTIFKWPCVPRGAACLTKCRCVSHHVCGVRVWL